MEKSEVIRKNVLECTYKIVYFTSENIKYTLYFINIFLYFTTMYIIKMFSDGAFYVWALEG